MTGLPITTGHTAITKALWIKRRRFISSPLSEGLSRVARCRRERRSALPGTRRNVSGFIWAYSAANEARQAGYIPASAWTPIAWGRCWPILLARVVLTRIWSSNPGEAGKVRIYLDNQPKPVIEARLLDLLSGNWEMQEGSKPIRLIPSPWPSERARRFELIFPIPFQQRCLVVVERPNLQYQINYRQYAAGTLHYHFQC